MTEGHAYERRLALPTGPSAPRLIQLLRWLRDPLGFLDQCAQRFGGIFTLPFLPGPTVIVSGGTANEVLFTDRRLSLPGEEELKTLLGERNTLLLSGREHKERRRILMPWFTGTTLADWGEDIRAMTRECLNRTVADIGKNPINVRDLMQEITLNVMLQIVFGSHEGPRRQKLRRDVTERMLSVTRPGFIAALWTPMLQKPWWGPWTRSVKAQQACDEAFYAEIANARANPTQGRTLLNILINATSLEGDPLPDRDIRDELMTLMVAGHENTATALSWAAYWIHRNPSLLGELLAELDSLPADADAIAISRLPMLEAVCHETMRLYPPVMMTLLRVAEEPIEMGDHLLPVGTPIRSSIYLTHRDPSIYADPDTFRPSRFIGKDYGKFSYMPFGGGGRRCLGASFAVFEMKLIIAEMLRGWSVRLPDRRVRPVRRTGLLAPDTRFSVRLRERRKPGLR